jgi:hypothetical protein
MVLRVQQEKASMRKFALGLAVLSLVALPLLAGEFNKKVSVGDKAPDFSGIPAVDAKGEDTSLTTSRKTWSLWCSSAITARSSKRMKTA